MFVTDLYTEKPAALLDVKQLSGEMHHLRFRVASFPRSKSEDGVWEVCEMGMTSFPRTRILQGRESPNWGCEIICTTQAELGRRVIPSENAAGAVSCHERNTVYMLLIIFKIMFCALSLPSSGDTPSANGNGLWSSCSGLAARCRVSHRFLSELDSANHRDENMAVTRNLRCPVQ